MESNFALRYQKTISQNDVEAGYSWLSHAVLMVAEGYQAGASLPEKGPWNSSQSGKVSAHNCENIV